MNIQKNSGIKLKKPRIVIFGQPKIGKTTLAASAPNPLFLLTEEGLGKISVDFVPILDDWDKFIATLKELDSQPKTYETIVIDSLTGLVEILRKKVVKTIYSGDESITGFSAYGRGWKDVANKFGKILIYLDRLRDKDYTIVLIAHITQKSSVDPARGDFVKSMPALEKIVWERIHPWADMILSVDFDYILHDKKVSETTGRFIFSTGSKALDAGCRPGYEIPAKINLDLGWQGITEGYKSYQLAKQIGSLTVITDQMKLDYGFTGELDSLPIEKLETILKQIKGGK